MEEKKYLSLKDKLTYGAGNFGSQFVMTFIGSFILIFMTDTIGLNSGTIGTLMAISMVLDGVTDVFFGTFIDRTHTKMGKARPWMLWGIFPLVICEVLLFMIPQAAGKTMQYAYFFIVYTLINAIFYTIVAVSYNTLSALITKNSDERVQIGVIGFIFNFAAAMLIPSVTPVLVKNFGGGTAGWRAVAIIYAVVAALGMLVTVLTAKELPEEVLNEGKEAAPKVKFRDNFKYLIRNKYFIFMLIAMIVFTMNSVCFLSTGSYFAKYILQNENTQTAIQFRHYAMYTHISNRRFIKSTLPSGNRKNSKKVAIWMASIAKMYIFTAFGCARTPYAAVGRKKLKPPAAVPAQRPSVRPTLAICGLFAFNTTGYTAPNIRPTFPQRGAILPSKGECYEQNLHVL